MVRVKNAPPMINSPCLMNRAKTWSVRHIVRALQGCRTPTPNNNILPASNVGEMYDVLSEISTIELPDSAADYSIFNDAPPAKFRIMESFSMSLSPSPTKQAHGDSLRVHQELQTEIAKKHEDLSKVKQEIWKLETQQGTQEMQNAVLDADVAELKKGMDQIKADISVLLSHETASLYTLDEHFKSTKQNIDVDFSQKLTRIKEELSDEIETSVSEMRQKDLAQKECLQTEVSRLYESIESKNSEVKQTLIALKEQHEDRISVLRATADSKLAVIKSETRALAESVTQKHADQVCLRENLQGGLKHTATHLDTTLNALRKKRAEKELQKKALSEQIAAIQSKIDSLDHSVASSKDPIETCEQAAKTYRETYAALEAERRQLHNKLQELKGNIRVYCRVKPSGNNESDLIPMQITSPEDLTPEGKQVLTLKSQQAQYDYGTKPTRSVSAGNGADSRTIKHKFELDRIFTADLNNRDIFMEISQLVQSSLDGFNVCVFAYGQTGSGKTWTMSHSEDGMIPLSINKIFSDIEELTAQGWQYTIDGQFVEIYNESIVDLLGPGKRDSKREIKHDDIAKTTTITNCATVRLESREQALEILSKATVNRSTASTLSNGGSSRSHSAFMLKIRGRHEESDTACEGTLNLVDLAGSERLNSSQAKGDRLKETRAINKSLSSLGDVIECLGERQRLNKEVNQAHVPFRNSKLTYLLKHSLGGDSKTLMFVNVSASSKNVSETINSLRFAKKVNGTKLR